MSAGWTQTSRTQDKNRKVVDHINRKVKLLIALLGSLLIAVPLYLFLHEGGHALVALLCSAQITGFSILGAHTSWVDGSSSPATATLVNAAGMLLPALVALVYALFYRSERTGIFYRVFSCIFIVVSGGSILAWVLVPALCLAGHVPANDDVAKFLQVSGWSPPLVMALALMLFSIVLGVVWRRRIL